MIRVLLADDQALIRAGFCSLIESTDDLCVVGEAADGDDAVRQVRRTRPDVVLMDIRMPHTDGLEATRWIVRDDTSAADGRHDGDPASGPRIIIVTTYESDEHVYAAIAAGASGFLVKDTEPEDLFHAIRVVAAGEALLSPRVTRRLIADLARRPTREARPAPTLEALTDREREVMGLVAGGLSNIEIATRLSLSPHTTKTHINRAMTKLGARDRAQLVVLAYQSGLISTGQ